MCAFVTGFDTCALPIFLAPSAQFRLGERLVRLAIGQPQCVDAGELRLAVVELRVRSIRCLPCLRRALARIGNTQTGGDYRGLAQTALRAGRRHQDRKSVGKGKSVQVRVDLGGRIIIQKKKTEKYNAKPSE